ncbi:DUF6266 family protein [Pedobacter heparinus]|uniref:DUF6266 family protein n=1 Tax=Pedobacter heparinus TaxID=984 RepID=UPI00292DE2FF|nr:DUF6266 family protein [Pedobacter heparinus]
MGIQQSGIFGPFRNKVGPAVGRHHMGQDLLTALPHPVKRKATAKQAEARLKFGLLNNFLKKIAPLVNVGFKTFVKQNTPVNEAFSYNYDRAFVKQGEEWLINYPEIIYSRGDVLSPEGVQVTSAEGKITFSWLPQKQSAYCQFTDQASFLVYNPAKKMRMILKVAVKRNALSFVMEMPVDFPGDAVHCYMSFASANGKMQGDSLYVGAVEVV